jgi:hypothetical protein
MVNLSIDSVDFYSPSQITTPVKDLDYDDSMIEYLVENVMGCPTTTFHDQANSNNPSKQQQNILHLDLKCDHLMAFSDFNQIQKKIVTFFPKNEKAVILYNKEVLPKPPQHLSV